MVHRSSLNQLSGGVGLRRGRKSDREISPGDALDWLIKDFTIGGTKTHFINF